jgi:hypothetical protein
MKRLQFLMEDQLVKQLDALVEETGLKTRTQLLNSALTLFEWAVRERKNGRVIASVDEIANKYKEIDLPGLPAVKQEEEDFDTLLQKIQAHVKTEEQGQWFADLIRNIRNNGLVVPHKYTTVLGPQDSLIGSDEEASTRAEAATTETAPIRGGDPKPAAAVNALKVRAQAVDAAQRMLGDSRAMPSAIAALKDENEWVREAAAKALGRIGDAQAVGPLSDALGDKDDFVGYAAAEALRRIEESEIGEEAPAPALSEELARARARADELAAQARARAEELRKRGPIRVAQLLDSATNPLEVEDKDKDQPRKSQE